MFNPVGSRGVELDYAEITTDSAGQSGGVADVTGLVIAPVIRDRPIIVEFQAYFVQNPTATGGWNVAILEDEVIVARDGFNPGAADTGAANKGKGAYCRARRTPSPGVHTYKVQLARAVAGTATMIASGGVCAHLQATEV